jgi:RND family efflux transporter MFP subunit
MRGSFCNAKRRPFGISAVFLCASLVSGCDPSRPPVRELTPVRVAQIQGVQTGLGAKYSADLAPYAQVTLSFKSAGYLDYIQQVRGADGRTRSLQEGDRVAKGALLARVQQNDYSAKLDQANAQLARAQAESEHAQAVFARASALYSTQSATKTDLDAATAQRKSALAAVNDAQAEVLQAQLALDDCTVRAPFDGWIVKRSVELGQLVGPSTPGFSLVDTSSVNAVFGVPDTNIQNIHLGARQSITTEAISGSFGGVITSISPAADPKSRVYSVEVTIPNPRNTLKVGMIVSLDLGGSPLKATVPVVPLSAVVRNPQQADAFSIFTVEGDGDDVTVRSHLVELGEPQGNMIVVTRGANLGDRVVVSGASLIKDNEKVRIIP